MRSCQLAICVGTLSLAPLSLLGGEDTDLSPFTEKVDVVEVFHFEAAFEKTPAVGNDAKRPQTRLQNPTAPKLIRADETDADVLHPDVLLPVIIQPVSNDQPRGLYAPVIDLPAMELADPTLPADQHDVTNLDSSVDPILLPEPLEAEFDLGLPPALDDMESLTDLVVEPAPSMTDGGTSTRHPYAIPPSPECEEVGGGDLTGELASALFRPLSEVRVAGLSTEPPLTDEPGGSLERPENAACEFFSDEFPAVYATAPCFAMPSPYRTPYPFTHHPLYYEDPNLERAGVSWGPLTTVKSIGVFGAQIAAWPVHAVIVPPRAHVPALPDCPSLNRFGPLAVFNEAWRKHNNYAVRIVPRKVVPKPPQRRL